MDENSHYFMHHYKTKLPPPARTKPDNKKKLLSILKIMPSVLAQLRINANAATAV